MYIYIHIRLHIHTSSRARRRVGRRAHGKADHKSGVTQKYSCLFKYNICFNHCLSIVIVN